MFERYEIKKGDNLSKIAERFNTTKEILQDINNLYYMDEFREGMDIIVPKNTKDYFNYYTIEKGDTIYGIARKYNINPSLLASLNGLNFEDYIYPNQEILVPKSGYQYYITAEGDTLDEVAKAFNVNRNKLLQLNETIYLMKDQLLVNKK